MAQALQHEENEDAFEDRKRRYKQSSGTARSSAFVAPGFNPPSLPRDVLNHQYTKHAKTAKASPFETKEDEGLTQEERDHRLAVALQEQEDNALKRQREASGDVSRRTSRSNAYSQIQRANRDAIMSYPNPNPKPSAFEQMVPSSIMAWTKGSVSFTSDTLPETLRKEKPTKTELEQRRLVQFKDDSDISQRSLTSRDGNIFPAPQNYGREMAYSPINLQRENSVVADHTNQIQQQDDQNSSLLSQVANHIIGTMGSWDTNGVCAPESSNDRGFRARSEKPNSSRPTPPQNSAKMAMEILGQEVQLMDVRDESSMPPPEPRFQIDWPSRVGSCHSWMIPETMGDAASFFGTSTRRGSYSNGISSVNSLEMDGSTNEHLSCTGSVGGGSLCNVFDPHADEIMHRALQQVPSWERSMRSKSPLSIGSVDEDDSLIRVRNEEKPAHTMRPIRDGPEEMDDDMDWEGHPE
jgi:hypothetical protein